MGGLLLELSLHADLDLADIGPTMRRLVGDITLPTLEVYTEGVLADRRYLDEYLLYITDPPTESPPPVDPTTVESETHQ